MQKHTNSVSQYWVAVDFFDCILLGSMDLNNVLQHLSFFRPAEDTKFFFQAKKRNKEKAVTRVFP